MGHVISSSVNHRNATFRVISSNARVPTTNISAPLRACSLILFWLIFGKVCWLAGGVPAAAGFLLGIRTLITKLAPPRLGGKVPRTGYEGRDELSGTIHLRIRANSTGTCRRLY